jgi:hypothetical protein
MVNPSRPPLPPNKPYHRPFNYLKCDQDANVRIFKVATKTNSETNDVEIINLFNFTLKDTIFDWCNDYMGDYPYCIFVELQLVFCKMYKKV